MSLIALVVQMVAEHGPIDFVDGDFRYALTPEAGTRLYDHYLDPLPPCRLTGCRNWPARRDFQAAAAHVLRCDRSTPVGRRAAQDILQVILADGRR